MTFPPVLVEIAIRHLKLNPNNPVTGHQMSMDIYDNPLWRIKAALGDAYKTGGRVKVKFARKPTNLQDVIAAALAPDTLINLIEIEDHVALDASEFDSFTKDFSIKHPWLDGMGGSKKAIKVTCVGKPTLFIDPSGYNYARHVGLEVI